MSAPGVRDVRERAARRYRPSHVRCLLVAEAPPAAPDRYFYFDEVKTADSLFREVAGVVLGRARAGGKRRTLIKLRDLGVFLIDLTPDPIQRGQEPDAALAASLVDRCREINPDAIILIKANVFDLAFAPLQAAGLPVLPVRIPFPGSGQQKRFRQAFASALHQAGMSSRT